MQLKIFFSAFRSRLYAAIRLGQVNVELADLAEEGSFVDAEFAGCGEAVATAPFNRRADRLSIQRLASAPQIDTSVGHGGEAQTRQGLG